MRSAIYQGGLTRSAAPSPVFKDGVRKRGSGSTLSMPGLQARGVEGLTSPDDFTMLLINLFAERNDL